jgi:predicted RNA-binding Zn-ribbon protein involved in translation (DUF1610 family)
MEEIGSTPNLSSPITKSMRVAKLVYKSQGDTYIHKNVARALFSSSWAANLFTVTYSYAISMCNQTRLINREQIVYKLVKLYTCSNQGCPAPVCGSLWRCQMKRKFNKVYALTRLNSETAERDHGQTV